MINGGQHPSTKKRWWGRGGWPSYDYKEESSRSTVDEAHEDMKIWHKRFGHEFVCNLCTDQSFAQTICQRIFIADILQDPECGPSVRWKYTCKSGSTHCVNGIVWKIQGLPSSVTTWIDSVTRSKSIQRSRRYNWGCIMMFAWRTIVRHPYDLPFWTPDTRALRLEVRKGTEGGQRSYIHRFQN